MWSARPEGRPSLTSRKSAFSTSTTAACWNPNPLRIRASSASNTLPEKSFTTPQTLSVRARPCGCLRNSGHFYIFSEIFAADTNRDVLPDDLVSVFYKQNCQFGFATHLFGSELKALYAHETAPRGIRFRISPTSHTDL